MDTPNCPDCDAPMEVGFIPDSSYDRVVQACWHRGKPERKQFLGIKLHTGSIKYEVESMIEITTFRCTSCGLLRSYALKNE